MNTWKKVKIGDICKIVKGATGIASAKPGEYPLVCTSVERKTCSTFQFDCEAVCIPLVSSSGHGKKSLNNVHYQKGKFALGTILCAVIPNNPQEVSAGYLHQYLQFYKDAILVPLMHGAANVSLSMRDIATVEIPLPDFKIQSKLAKMFVEMQNKLKEINAEFVKQKSYAKQLRQNILQEAIEGKLTAEWRKNHPMIKGDPDFDADALFAEIVASKASSASFAKTKTNKPLPPITDEEKLFEIPAGWKWVRLGEISKKITDGSHSPPPNTGKGYPVISAMNIKNGKITFSKIARYTDEEGFQKENKRTQISRGDIIMGIIGASIGNIAIYNHDEKVIAQRSIAIINTYISNIFIEIVLNSKFIQNTLQKKSFGSAQGGIYLGKISNLFIPLPPLKEQEEIVNKVEKLLNNVVELEQQISQREEYARQLMQSVLRDAFVGR